MARLDFWPRLAFRNRGKKFCSQLFGHIIAGAQNAGLNFKTDCQRTRKEQSAQSREQDNERFLRLDRNRRHDRLVNDTGHRILKVRSSVCLFYSRKERLVESAVSGILPAQARSGCPDFDSGPVCCRVSFAVHVRSPLRCCGRLRILSRC